MLLNGNRSAPLWKRLNIPRVVEYRRVDRCVEGNPEAVPGKAPRTAVAGCRAAPPAREDLWRESERLRKENERLRERVAESDKQIADRDRRIADHDRRIADQEKQIGDLERQLAGWGALWAKDSTKPS